MALGGFGNGLSKRGRSRGGLASSTPVLDRCETVRLHVRGGPSAHSLAVAQRHARHARPGNMERHPRLEGKVATRRSNDNSPPIIEHAAEFTRSLRNVSDIHLHLKSTGNTLGVVIRKTPSVVTTEIWAIFRKRPSNFSLMSSQRVFGECTERVGRTVAGKLRRKSS